MEEYSSFCGLQQGADAAAVRRVLGPPAKVGYPSKDFYYFFTGDKAGLEVRFSAGSDEVMTIDVKGPGAVKALRKRGIKDPRLDWMGKGEEEILKTYGRPWLGKRGYPVLQYRYAEEGRELFVSFDMAYKDRVCEAIKVFWVR